MFKKWFSKRNLNSWGLIFNIFGSTLIVFSIGANLGMYYTDPETGRRYYDAVFYNLDAGRIGFGLLAIGFYLMFVANNMKEQS